MRVVLTTDDGDDYDVTKHFLLLYETATNCMDWGSGMLDTAEQLRMLQAGALIGGLKVDKLASITNLEAQFPEKSPRGRGDYYSHQEYRERLAAWYKRRDAWVAEQSVIRFGEHPTFESIGELLGDVEERMDDVTNFDEVDA